MVSKWKAKAIVQKGISYLPQREKINFIFQKYVTKGVELTDEHFGYKIQHAKDHLQFLEKYGSFENNQILELGTGWYPIIPIAFYLKNAGRVISIDIQNWMTQKSQIHAIEKIVEWKKKGKLDEFFQDVPDKKWHRLNTIHQNPGDYTKEDIEKIIGLTPMVKDARTTDLPSHSFDFICSNNTFEHIPKSILEGILIEFKRLIKPLGLMSHFIDMSDHFAHFDSTITIYNFLKFSEKQWNWIDNRIQPQNRMRMDHYRKLFTSLNIPITEEVLREGEVELLREIKVHPEFQDLSPEELAISHGYIISHFD